MIQPGTYRLKRTITNPKPHKRNGSTDWRRAPTFEEGTLYHIAPHYEVEGLFTMRLCYGRWTHQELTNHDAAFLELLFNLEPAEVTPSIWLDREHQSSGWLIRDVLDKLYTDKVITVDQIKACVAAIQAEEDKETHGDE